MSDAEFAPLPMEPSSKRAAPASLPESPPLPAFSPSPPSPAPEAELEREREREREPEPELELEPGPELEIDEAAPRTQVVAKKKSIPIEEIPGHLCRWLEECGIRHGPALVHNFSVKYYMMIGNDSELAQCRSMEESMSRLDVPHTPLDYSHAHFAVATVFGEPFPIPVQQFPGIFETTRLTTPFHALDKTFATPLDSTIITRLVQAAYIHFRHQNAIQVAMSEDQKVVPWPCRVAAIRDNWIHTLPTVRNNVLGDSSTWRPSTNTLKDIKKRSMYMTQQWLTFWEKLQNHSQLRPLLPSNPWEFIPRTVMDLRKKQSTSGLTSFQEEQDRKFDVAFGLMRDPVIVRQEQDSIRAMQEMIRSPLGVFMDAEEKRKYSNLRV